MGRPALAAVSGSVLGEVVRLVPGHMLVPHSVEEALKVSGVALAVEERRAEAGLPHAVTDRLEAEGHTNKFIVMRS